MATGCTWQASSCQLYLEIQSFGLVTFGAALVVVVGVVWAVVSDWRDKAVCIRPSASSNMHCRKSICVAAVGAVAVTRLRLVVKGPTRRRDADRQLGKAKQLCTHAAVPSCVSRCGVRVRTLAKKRWLCGHGLPGPRPKEQQYFRIHDLMNPCNVLGCVGTAGGQVGPGRASRVTRSMQLVLPTRQARQANVRLHGKVDGTTNLRGMQPQLPFD
jgi:hypothetical protein